MCILEPDLPLRWSLLPLSIRSDNEVAGIVGVALMISSTVVVRALGPRVIKICQTTDASTSLGEQVQRLTVGLARTQEQMSCMTLVLTAPPLSRRTRGTGDSQEKTELDSFQEDLEASGQELRKKLREMKEQRVLFSAGSSTLD
jgi:hypothetical protein